MMRYKAGKRTDFGKHSNLKAEQENGELRETDLSNHLSWWLLSTHLINLFHHSIQHLTLEGPENNGLVLDRIHHESLTRLNDTGANLVDGGHRYHKSILAGAGALHFGVQFLFNGLQQLWTKVTRMQQDFMLHRNLQDTSHPLICQFAERRRRIQLQYLRDRTFFPLI